jgi:hypothetical protein
VRLEANQYKRLAKEKLAHDRESLTYFEDLIHRKDEEIAALECEVQAYRHRLLSIGFDDLEIGKIRWPGRSYPSNREEDCDSWTSSCTEELEGFDGYDALGWKTQNNDKTRKEIDFYLQSRDVCQPQLQWGKGALKELQTR